MSRRGRTMLWWFWRALAAMAVLSLMTVAGFAYLILSKTLSWKVLLGGLPLLVVVLPLVVFGVFCAKYLVPAWTISRRLWRIARIARREVALARNCWRQARWETTRPPSALG